MLYWIYRISLFLLRIFSRKAAYRVAGLIGKVQYALSKKDRELVKANLRSALPEAGEREISSRAREVFVNFGIYLVDFFYLMKGSPGYLEKTVRLTGIENIHKALEAGRGCIILTAHFGNWEMGGCVLAKQGFGLNVVALAHSDGRINDLFLRQRRAAGINVIPLGKARTDCQNALKRGEAVAILGDRLYGDHGIEIDFFGKKAIVPRGGALLSLKNGSPVVLVFAHKEGDINHVVCDPPYLVRREGDKDKELAEIIQRFIRRLEFYIKKYPSQWFMFNSAWKES